MDDLVGGDHNDGDGDSPITNPPQFDVAKDAPGLISPHQYN